MKKDTRQTANYGLKRVSLFYIYKTAKKYSAKIKKSYIIKRIPGQR